MALEEIRVTFKELTAKKFKEVAGFTTPPSVVGEVAFSFCKMIFQGASVDWQQF